MSGKKAGKKKYKRRGRRTNPGQIAAVAVCAVTVCALLVCMITYGVSYIIGQRSGSKTREEGAGITRVEKPVQEEEEAPMADASAERSSEKEAQSPQTPEEGEGAPAGNTLSIVGDSISTFRDYIPAGYYDFFPDNGVSLDVDDTWWKQVLDDLGYTLYVNASSSGSTCVGDSTGTDNPQCGCNEFRTGALYGPDGDAPSVIIVYMGTNDLLQSIPLGDNDGTRQVAEGKVSAFSDAYTLMLDKLSAKYPSSKIYCCTILPVGIYGTSTPYVDFVNGEELTAADYSGRITQIAQNKGFAVIDLNSCGITVDNLHHTTADGVHPTQEGMQYIAEAVRKVLE